MRDTKTTGTAMAAFVPDDIPPATSFLARAVASFAAAEVDVVPVVVVPAPDEEAAALVLDDAAVDDAGIDVDCGEALDEALDADVLEFVVGVVEVSNVEDVLLKLVLSSDCKDAKRED